MLNYIWLGLVLAAVVMGGCGGQMKAITDGAFEAAKAAVMNIALPLAGYMALWLGIMRLAEKSEFVRVLAALIRPVMRRLFPDVPPDHPAMGAMLMNMAANMLGLGNAATPLGLRAMAHLETLNRRPGTATNAMCTFLAINTASIQLVPATAVGLLSAAGAKDPTAIIGTALVATACAATAGIVAVKLLEKLPAFRLGPPPAAAAAEGAAEGDGGTRRGGAVDARTAGDGEATDAVGLAPVAWWGWLALGCFLAAFGWWFVAELRGVDPAADAVLGRSGFARVVGLISRFAIPFFIGFFPLYAAIRRVKVYEEFVEGAKEGFNVAVRIIPYLVAILVAVGMFRAAGGMQWLAGILGPVLAPLGFPTDLLPLVFIRPLSGSGATGMFAELLKNPAIGPDSLTARMAATILGSTETTFYVLAVYFGAVAVRRTRHAVLAGLTADATGVVVSVIVCRLMFG